MKTKRTGVIMSAPMILALNADRKTVTRRNRGLEDFGRAAEVASDLKRDDSGRWGVYVDPLGSTPDTEESAVFVPCPYGGPGDELWFREGIRKIRDEDRAMLDSSFPFDATYIADGAGAPIERWIWKNSALPAIHMPEKFCRHFGTLTEGVRAERLLEIDDADAIAEGIRAEDGAFWIPAPPDSNLVEIMFSGVTTARDAYFALWDMLHGVGSHKRNPLVWRLPFTPRKK